MNYANQAIIVCWEYPEKVPVEQISSPMLALSHMLSGQPRDVAMWALALWRTAVEVSVF